MNVLPEDDYFYNSAPKLPVSRRKWISNTQSILWNYSANKTKLGLNFTNVCYSFSSKLSFSQNLIKILILQELIPYYQNEKG